MSQTFDALTKLKEDKDSAYKAFQKTDLWKAIFCHIEDSEDCILIEAPKESIVCCFPGTGYAISIDDLIPVRIIGSDYSSLENYIWCDISVTFYIDPNTNDQADQSFRLEIPDVLVSDFNKDRFNEWVLEVKQSRDARFHAEEIYTLKSLMKKYPQIVSESNNELLRSIQ